MRRTIRLKNGGHVFKDFKGMRQAGYLYPMFFYNMGFEPWHLAVPDFETPFRHGKLVCPWEPQITMDCPLLVVSHIEVRNLDRHKMTQAGLSENEIPPGLVP